jgi:histidinol dehydrogenase
MKVKTIEGKVLDSVPLNKNELFLTKELVSEVEKIIEEVREFGDSKVIEFCKKFDGVGDDFNIVVSEEEINKSIKEVESNNDLMKIADTFLKAAERIRKFHEEQLKYFNLSGKWVIEIGNGRKVGQVIKPVDSVMVYVPGGRAIYPSTLIMNLIPAKVAGVNKIFVSTPSQKGKVSPIILYLAKRLGANGIFKVGGAVSVASFAFGTQTIPKVDMIVGPGNKYFVLAKKLLSGIVGIDIIPGPSEIAILATYGNPKYFAYDLLSQLEHDPDSSAFMISTNSELLEKIQEEIIDIIPNTSRKNILDNSTKNLFFIEVSSIEEGFDIVNQIAPEHLEIVVDGIDINNIDNYVKHAGTVLIGLYSPVVITDYFAGTNHVLPTNSTAKFSSPLGVYNFVKMYNICEWEKNSLLEDMETVSELANYEGLEIHAKSILERK